MPMVIHFDNQMIGALIRFLNSANMVRVRAQNAAIYMALILLLFRYILSLWNNDLEVVHQQGLSVDYGSNNDILKISWKGGVDGFPF